MNDPEKNSIKNTGPSACFRVPEGFFEQQESRIMQTISILQAAELGNTLAGVAKQTFFTQPAGAENQLTQQIKTAISKRRSSFTLPNFTLRPAFAIVLFFIAVATIWFIWQPKKVATQEWTQISDLNDDDLAEFVATHHFFDLVEMLSEKQDKDEILAFVYDLPIADEAHLEEYLELDYQHLEINENEE
jgi:hypothetical protein